MIISAKKILAKKELCFVFTFCASVIFFISFIFTLSVFVDPRGIFGTNLIKPVILTNRTEKLNVLGAKNPPPEIIIFGSSRVFEMDPLLVQKYSGWRAYNASVSYARPEEYLSMAKYIVNDLGIKPKIFLVGFSVGEFNNDDIDPQTIMSPLLRKYLPISRKQILIQGIKIFKESINPRYLRDIGLALFWRATSYPDEQVAFDENGYQKFDKNAPINRERISQSRPAVDLFLNLTNLNSERKKYFESFLKFSGDNNIEVIAFITPMPGISLQALRKQTQYETIYQELVALMNGLENENYFKFYDFSGTNKFNGDEESGFNDSTHPSHKNLDIIVKKIFGGKT